MSYFALIKIIFFFRTKAEKITIADFGCGEAKIAASLQTHAKVHSFDLVALNDRVTQCDMSHTQLQSSTVDVAVFCLSLMGTNISGYIKEANRVLKDEYVLYFFPEIYASNHVFIFFNDLIIIVRKL